MREVERQNAWGRSGARFAKLAVPAFALTVGAYATSEPNLPSIEPLALTVRPLEAARTPAQTVRTVNPSVGHIASWISAAGAGAALGDLDGDGLMNDLCLVDPRSDTVSISTLSADSSIAAHLVRAVLDPGSDARAVAPMGCRLADLNDDGWTDVLVYYWGRPPMLFLNRREWRFESEELVPHSDASRDWYSNAGLIADLNGDGLLDIFIGNYFPEGSELLDPDSQRRVSMHSSFSRAYNGGTNRVLLQRRGMPGRFDLAAAPFAPDNARGWTLAVAAADLDGDLLPEIFVSNDFGPDRLFANRSSAAALTFEPISAATRKFREPLSHVLGRDSFKGMGVTLADLDNDADLDIVVSNITHRFGLFESHMLFLNHGSKDDPFVFHNASEELRTARTAFSWDNKVADLNNDGSPEVLQATGFVRGKVDRWPEIQEIALANDVLVPNPDNWPNLVDGDISGEAPRIVLTRAGAVGPFQNIAEVSGLDDIGVTRGIAVADIDGDGDLDWVEANQFAVSRLVINECQPCGAFLGLRLLRVRDATQPAVRHGLIPAHTVSGSTAIGASVSLALPTGERRVAFVDGGNGHSGQQSTDIHFGLAQPTSAAHTVEVTWRDFDGNVRTTTMEVTQTWQTLLLPS